MDIKCEAALRSLDNSDYKELPKLSCMHGMFHRKGKCSSIFQAATKCAIWLALP